MFSSFVLSLREGIEAALIIGIVLGALKKFQRESLSPAVWTGAIVAAILSLVVALLLHSVGTSLEGSAEPIFEGITMLLAAGVLTWMIFWMRTQSRNLKGNLETGVRQATLQKGRRALAVLAFVAVLREGVELALFLTAATLASNTQQALFGALLGLGAAALLGWSLFASALRLDLKRFFLFTGVLLILFAAGLVAHSVHEFNEVGWIPAIIPHVWDLNYLMNENSFIGQVLTTLFGYNGNPSLTEAVAYLSYFAVIWVGYQFSRWSVPASQKV